MIVEITTVSGPTVEFAGSSNWQIDFAISEPTAWQLDFAQVGIQGASGKSAYQIAVDNGFQGTQAEWIASLQVGVQISSDPGNAIDARSDGIYVPEPMTADGGLDLVVLFENRL